MTRRHKFIDDVDLSESTSLTHLLDRHSRDNDINETLNRGKSRTQFPNKFTIDNKSITDHKEIADQFNIFFCKYWC